MHSYYVDHDCEVIFGCVVIISIYLLREYLNSDAVFQIKV